MSRVALLEGEICSFQERCPYKRPHFFGGILLIPKYIAVPDKALQANQLAMLSDIGNNTEDLHAYVLGA